MNHFQKKLYHMFVKLYPEPYQRRYGVEMEQTFADMLADSPTVITQVLVWLRIGFDLPLSLSRQHAHAAADTWTHTPPYAKTTSIVGGFLLVPFFVLIAVNAVLHDVLYRSYFWHPKVLFFWIAALPAIALVINSSAFLYWAVLGRKSLRPRHSLHQIYKQWPLVVVIVLSAGIIALVFGHDSVHCVTGNPLREVHQWHQTLQCIQRG